MTITGSKTAMNKLMKPNNKIVSLVISSKRKVTCVLCSSERQNTGRTCNLQRELQWPLLQIQFSCPTPTYSTQY